MDTKMLENPVVVRMIQSVVFQSLLEKVEEEKDYLNNCSIDEFVRISELIRDDEDYSFDILKDIIYNIVEREDLRPVCNLVLANISYYLEKFDECDYKYQEFMLSFLLTQYKKDVCLFNKNLLKYSLELIKNNLQKFKPDCKSEILNMIL